MSRSSNAVNTSGVSGATSHRRLSIVSGLLMLMVFGVGALPAAAETRERAATAEGSDITQALVVGGGAFALIIALAGAVLFYTAKGRRL